MRSRSYVLMRTRTFEEIGNVRRILEEAFQEKPPQFYPFTVTIAMGEAVEDGEKLQDCFITADRTLWERLRLGCGRILFYQRDVKKWDQEEQVPEEIKGKIQKGVLTLNQQAAEDEVEQYLEDLGKMEQPVYCLKNQVCRLLELVDSITENSQGKGKTEEVKEMERRLDSCMDLEQLLSLGLCCCRQMIETCIAGKTEKNSRAVRKVQHYLGQHVREEINLDKIASQVGLTGAYISTIFKKETGMTLTSYLIQLRIERAKELIRNTDKTINEIAYEVGYVDARYFSKLFIKTVGIKPVEYRRFYAK